VLAPAQQEIGRRWQQNQLSVTQEHAATAITDMVLARVGALIDEPVGGAVVALACAEGDWHSLPARMAAELLRADGHRVRFLGASVPAGDLGHHLEVQAATALCLSCSVPLHLPGALRSIEAAHRVGIPVVAGGPGFGRDDHAALRTGADDWAPTAAAAAKRLSAWRRRPPSRLASSDVDMEGWMGISLATDDLVAEMSHRLADEAGQVEATWLTNRSDDLTELVRYLGVAVLVHDDRVLVEYLRWLAPVLDSRATAGPTGSRSALQLTAALGALQQAFIHGGDGRHRIARLLQAAVQAVP